jgi:hypothetical protein
MIWFWVMHIAVLGYWLGSELVINSTYRYVCYADQMPFNERARMMDHVMHVDQHVRYALVLQATLGLILSVQYGFIPGDQSVIITIAVCGLLWLGFVEAVHRLRKKPAGVKLARIDRASRYILLVVLLALSVGLIGDDWPMPDWLRWKLAAFAGVVASGVGIRIALIAHFRTWKEMAEYGATPERNATIKRCYMRATSVLVLLWVLIAAVVYLSVAKP